ncbi:arginine ABC transporter permease ArtM [Shewanella sp. GXUN23E]|uniref:arginine ABC transporter permease ArtM n=1 Tax=Shewanella sp. GXUN23E TaxID=3422498 RepID=UPI003D7E97EC
MLDSWISTFSTLLNGLGMTLALTFIALTLGTVLAIVNTVALTSSRVWVRGSIRVYLTLLTGTPLLVQIFLIYYGPGQFPWLKDSALWSLFSSPFFCAVLALSLNCAAYTTLLFSGALSSIGRGQWDACAALGLNHRQTLTVLLPYALRRALPTYSNEMVLLLKGSALASTITIMDIMGWAQRLNAQTYDTLRVFFAAGILYLSLNLLLTGIMSLVERRMLAFEHP